MGKITCLDCPDSLDVMPFRQDYSPVLHYTMIVVHTFVWMRGYVTMALSRDVLMVAAGD